MQGVSEVQIKTKKVFNFREIVFNLVFKLSFLEKKHTFNPDKINKILLIRNDNIGDLVCSTPVLEAIKTDLPHVYLAVLLQEKTKGVIEYNPFVDRIYSYIKPKEAKGVWQKCVFYFKKLKMLLEIRKEKFDVSLVVKSDFSFSQGLFSFMSGARFRVGHYPHKRRNLKYAFLHNIYVKDSRTILHEVERSLNIIRTLGINVEKKKLLVNIPPGLLEEIKKFIRDNQVNKFVVLHVSAKRDRGLWNEKLISALIRGIKKEFKVNLFLTYLPTDEERVKKIKNMSQDKLFSIFTPGILHLGAILKAASFFISPEGGQVHLSSALDVPAIAVFFREDSLLGWEPWGNNTDVVMVREENEGFLIDNILSLLKKKEVLESSRRLL